MSGFAWLVIIVIIIVICVLLIRHYFGTRGGDTNTTTLDKPPTSRAVGRKPTSTKSRPRVLNKASREIRLTLSQGHQLRRTITIQYETAEPKPGQPAINIRNVDVYALGEEYFDAFCHLRSDMRVFKISRVKWAQLTTGTYQIPVRYTPSTWVEYGWGEVQDKRLEGVEAVLQTTSDTAPSDKWIWPRTNNHWTDQAPTPTPPSKPQPSSRKASPSKSDDGRAKSYVRHDWKKRFEDSIISPFPEELSPARPYLREAYRLQEEGAAQAEIDQVLQKAREADPQATSFYVSRQSIITKRKAKRAKRKPQPPTE